MKKSTKGRRAARTAFNFAPLTERPTPTQIRLSIEANQGTPAIAAIIGRVMEESGAIVSFTDKRVDRLKKQERLMPLAGLRVTIDRLTWVRHEEAERWASK